MTHRHRAVTGALAGLAAATISLTWVGPAAADPAEPGPMPIPTYPVPVPPDAAPAPDQAVAAPADPAAPPALEAAASHEMAEAVAAPAFSGDAAGLFKAVDAAPDDHAIGLAMIMADVFAIASGRTG